MATAERVLKNYRPRGILLDPDLVAAWRSENHWGGTHWSAFAGDRHNARLGSLDGPDTNDPLHLRPDGGVQYAYFPGAGGNTLRSSAVSVSWDETKVVARVRPGEWPFSVLRVVSDSSAVDGESSFGHTLAVVNDRTMEFRYRQSDNTLIIVASNAALPSTLTAPWLWLKVEADVVAGVGFFYSFDDTFDESSVTWTQLGSTQPLGGDGTRADLSQLILSRNHATSGPWLGGISKVRWEFHGVTFASPDFTDRNNVTEPFNSFTDAQGNVWTFDRSDAGRKLTVVDRPLWLLGTDDYFEVPHHADLNPDTGPFTVVSIIRFHGSGTTDTIIRKRDGVSPGWRSILASARRTQHDVFGPDGSAIAVSPSNIYNSGVLFSTALRLTEDAVENVVNGAVVATEPRAGVGSIAGSGVLRIGMRSDHMSNPYNGVIVGAAIFRRALTDAEIAQVAEELMV